MRKPLLLALALLGASSLLRAQIDVDQVLNIGRNAIYFKDYIVSMGYFNQVIGLRPWMAEPYLYRSIAKISLDDYAGASADASLALERNPLLSRAYLIRGIAHLASKEYQAATQDFRQGLSLSPADQGMHHNLPLPSAVRPRASGHATGTAAPRAAPGARQHLQPCLPAARPDRRSPSGLRLEHP